MTVEYEAAEQICSRPGPTKWAVPSTEKTGWYTIQTGTYPSPAGTNFTLRRGTSSVHTFTWRPGQVQFQSTSGDRTYRWSYSGVAVPVPGDETPRMNLRLYQGTPPSSGNLSVIVQDFTFAPLSPFRPPADAPRQQKGTRARG